MKKTFQHKSLIERAITNFEEFVRIKVLESVDNPEDYAQEDYTEVNRKIKKVIIWSSINKGFYAELMSNLDIYGSSDMECKTMCTNGREIIFHPDFVKNQKEEALRLVLAHEILHCIGKHQERRGSRDPKGWNIACDYAINPILGGIDPVDKKFKLETGFEWPVDESGNRMGLYEEKYEGMRAEDIYDLLIEEGVLNPDGKPKSSKLEKQAELGEVVDEDSEVPGPGQGMDIQVSDDDEPNGGQNGSGDDGDEGDEEGDKPGNGSGDEGDEEGEGDGPGNSPGNKPSDKPGNNQQQSQLPRVGQKVRLSDGREAVIKKVYPNGDIEV
jgi:hypothetical protein